MVLYLFEAILHLFEVFRCCCFFCFIFHFTSLCSCFAPFVFTLCFFSVPGFCGHSESLPGINLGNTMQVKAMGGTDT